MKLTTFSLFLFGFYCPTFQQRVTPVNATIDASDLSGDGLLHESYDQVVGLRQNCTADDDCDVKRSECNAISKMCECRDGFMQSGAKCKCCLQLINVL